MTKGKSLTEMRRANKLGLPQKLAYPYLANALLFISTIVEGF
jgi:hypothetical protein